MRHFALAGAVVALILCFYFERISDDVEWLPSPGSAALPPAVLQAVRDTDRAAFLTAASDAATQRRLRDGTQSPSLLYALTEMSEDVSEEARTIIGVAMMLGLPPNGDGDPRYHPLSNAYRRNLLRVASRLLAADGVVREVYASVLSCRAVALVDPSVALVVNTTEPLRPCVQAHKTLRTYATSQLVALYRRKHPGKRFPESVKAGRLYSADPVVAPPSTVREGLWNDPFQLPPLSTLPPLSAAVMNPIVFEDFCAAMAYYVLGPPWSTRLYNAVLATCCLLPLVMVTFFTLLCCRVVAPPLPPLNVAGAARPVRRERRRAGE